MSVFPHHQKRGNVGCFVGAFKMRFDNICLSNCTDQGTDRPTADRVKFCLPNSLSVIKLL